MSDKTPVSFSLYNPSKPSLFGKSSKNKKAKSTVIYCELEDCPLRDKGECICCGISLGNTFCPYGTRKTQTGYTQRAKKFYKWIKEKKKEYEDIPHLSAPPKKLAFIGDWVYLPYPHMNLNEQVPFKSHGTKLLGHGKPFIKQEDWCVKTIESIVNFKPHAIMGNEISSYQNETVPKFCQHIREEDPEMWDKVLGEMPELEKHVTDYIGRKAKLKTVDAPIEWTTQGRTRSKYPVTWRWDGEKLTTTSHNAYQSTWGVMELKEMKLTATPADDATIEIQENSWVNDETEFVD